MNAPALTPIALLLLGSLVALLGGTKLRSASLASIPLALGALFIGFGSSAAGWWAIDRLGLTLGATALVIGLCATRFALRQFMGERRGGPIVAASLLVVGTVVATDLAATPAALVLSWAATSGSTVLLLRAGAGKWSSGAVRSAARTFAVADGALVTSVLVVWEVAGSAALTAPLSSRTALVGSAGAILLVGTVLAAAGRAGMTGRRSWVLSTIATPTPVSVLLHAGVVNAGALLLLRVEMMTGSRWWLAAGLAAISVGVIVRAAPRIHARVDLKGQLAASTISQMAFMLLAIAVGWPLLAVTHLIGHGLYKAGRVMASGAATASRVRLRRRAPVGRLLPAPGRALGAAAILGVAGVLALRLGGDALAVMGVMAPGAVAVWWVRTRQRIIRPVVMVVGIAGALATYGVVVAGAQGLLGEALPGGAWQAPWWTLGLAVVAVAVLGVARRHRPRRLGTVERLVQPSGRSTQEAAA